MVNTGEMYHDIYKGIIIQNDDPENMGRAKVFVPHITMTLYKDWNEKVDEDKFFRFLGQNLDSALTAPIIKRLKESLHWAEVLQPVFGPSGNGYYWAEMDHGTIEQGAVIEAEPPVLEPEVEDVEPELPTVDQSQTESGATNAPSIGNTPSALHGPPQRKEIYTTFYHANESGSDPDSLAGKTVGNSPSYYGNRIGGTADGAFRNGGSGSIGTIAVDPTVIPYGSYIDVRATDGTTRRYVAGDTGSAVVNRTAAKANGSSSPVIDIHIPRNEWDKTIQGGNQTVVVYPYKGENFLKLSSEQKESFYSASNIPSGGGGSSGGVELPSGEGGIDAGLFPSTGLDDALENPILPPNLALPADDIKSSAGNSLNSSNTSDVNVAGNNILNPSKTTQEAGKINGEVEGRETKKPNNQTPNTLPLMRPPQGNLPNGFLSIPDVGSHVWVRYEGGDPMKPIIVGSIYTKEDHLLNHGYPKLDDLTGDSILA